MYSVLDVVGFFFPPVFISDPDVCWGIALRLQSVFIATFSFSSDYMYVFSAGSGSPCN